MSRTIQMKRGLLADLPQLLPGEFAFTIDTHEVFIGSAEGNVPMVNSDKMRELELSYEQAAALLEETYAPELANLKANDTSINAQIAAFNQTIAAMNRGLGTTMASMAQLLSTYPTGDGKDHIVAGNIAEVDTLTVTTVPTTAGDVTVTLNGVAKTVPVTVGRAEVASLLVTAVPTVAGNVTVTLNGISQTVAIDPAVETTTDLVAAKIRGTFFSGWVASGTGSTVVFTSTTTGTKADAVYSAGTTGATGTMSTTTQGIAEATTTIVAAAIRAAVYPGWNTGGTGSVVTFTATTVGTRTAPTFSGGTTGAAASLVRTVVGEASNFHRYFWNGTAWTDGGLYQAVEVADKGILKKHVSDEAFAEINRRRKYTSEDESVAELVQAATKLPNEIKGARDGVTTGWTILSGNPQPVAVANEETELPFSAAKVPFILRLNYQFSSGALYYAGRALPLNIGDAPMEGVWIRSSDVAAIPHGSLDFTTIYHRGAGTADDESNSIPFNSVELQTVGTEKTSVPNKYGTTATARVAAVSGEWSYVTMQNSAASPIAQILSWYIRITGGVNGDVGKLDIANPTIIKNAGRIFPHTVYYEDDRDSSLSEREVRNLLATELSKNNSAVSLAESKVSLMKGIEVGTYDSFSDLYKGSYAYADNDYTEFEAPFTSAFVPKKLIWTIDGSKIGTNNFAYIGFQAAGLSEGEPLITGLWMNKATLLSDSDVTGLDGVVYAYKVDGSTAYSTVTPRINRDALIAGVKTTRTYTYADEIITYTLEVEAEYGDWVYVTLKIGTVSPEVVRITSYYRVTGITAATLLPIEIIGVNAIHSEVISPFTMYASYVKKATQLYVDTEVIDLNTKLTGKVDRINPFVEGGYVNAVRGKYTNDPDAAVDGRIMRGTSTILSYEFNEVAYEKYGMQNVVAASYTGKSRYTPIFAFTAGLEELAAIGVVPDDLAPPTISIGGGFMKGTLQGQTLASIQIWFAIRYGGSASIGTYDVNNDVTFTNGNGHGSHQGADDTFWNHSAMLVENDDIKGWAHKGIEIPATYKGKAFTHIAIRIIGWNADEVNSHLNYIEAFRPVIIAGHELELLTKVYDNPDDRLTAAIVEDDLSLALQAKLNTTASINEITIQNSDKIVMIGDSFTACHYTLKGKAYIDVLSLLSDWNFENFARSGDDYAEMNYRVKTNTPEYHPSLGIKDYGGTYAILISNANDGYFIGMDEQSYYDNLKGLVESVEALGMKPIIATEFGTGTNGDERKNKGLRAFADARGLRYIDVSVKSRLFNINKYLPFWGAGHPATRTVFLWVDTFRKHVEALPRPKQGIKIFRKRDSVAVADIQDLMFEYREDRMKNFKEIMVGHHALNATGKPYYDELDQVSSNEKIYSEYLKLQNNESIAFGDYALVEVVTPATAKTLSDFTLQLSDPTVRVFGRHAFNTPFEDVAKYQAFLGASDVSTLLAGATYTSDSAGLVGKTFTVNEVYNGWVSMSPYVGSAPAGTLTKVAGTGPATITYSSSAIKADSSWYEQLYKPEGEWVEIIGVDGDFNIGAAAVKNFMNYDKFTFLLNKTGGFSLNDIKATWSGEEGKVYETTKQVAKDSRGAEILAQTKMGNGTELGGWVVTGSLTPFVPTDSVLPYGTTGCVEITPSNYLSQNITYAQEVEYTRDLQIKVWCRVYPELFSHTSDIATAPITEDSFDFGTIAVESFNIGGGNSVIQTDVVGLHWQETIVNVQLATFTTGQTIRIYSKDKAIQVARVSAKLLD